MSFDTADMASALPEVTNGENLEATGPVKDQQAFDTARELGWVVPKPFIYDAGPKIATSRVASDGSAAEKAHESQWAHEAKKYEWKEEYGDVGPKIPELEKELFGNEHITRRGSNVNEYYSQLVNVRQS